MRESSHHRNIFLSLSPAHSLTPSAMRTTLGVHSSQPQDEGLFTSADAYVTLVKIISLQTALHIALLKFLFAYYLSY